MTDEQILRAAIERAKRNGYKHIVEDGKPCEMTDYNSPTGFCVYTTVFDHDFAKAFWGEKGKEVFEGTYYQKTTPEWEQHLMKMVIKKDPIQYLEQFLK